MCIMISKAAGDGITGTELAKLLLQASTLYLAR